MYIRDYVPELSPSSVKCSSLNEPFLVFARKMFSNIRRQTTKGMCDVSLRGDTEKKRKDNSTRWVPATGTLHRSFGNEKFVTCSFAFPRRMQVYSHFY